MSSYKIGHVVRCGGTFLQSQTQEAEGEGLWVLGQARQHSESVSKNMKQQRPAMKL
jgi:hypothetical protein